MVVKTANEYIIEQLAGRIRHLQDALNQAEKIVHILEKENEKLKDVLTSLASEKNEGYVLNSETFDEPVFTI
jgi:ABC-type transporter Mla subunit MlaD